MRSEIAPDAVIRKGFDAFDGWTHMEDRLATAAKRMKQAIDDADLRDSGWRDGNVDDAEAMRRDAGKLCAAFANLMNAIRDDAEGIGLRVGEEFSPDPSQYDFLIEHKSER